MKKLTTREILEKNLKRTSPLGSHFILWMHNIRSLHNVGAVFRSADAFGIRELRLSGHTPVPPRPEITKTAIGAEQYVEWKEINNPVEEINTLKRAGYTIAVLEQTDRSTPLNEWTPESDKICLILGNEVTGVDDELIELADLSVDIPQFGNKHSLNVSVAAGVALYGILEKFYST
ncbi:TrmH family RNA methyltransferase [Rhodohalobacter mucosus]|uniref:RNA methyltransferase n=1 Tax=Rhodohalobacter mucosus TaxID=2079485 RepID=A0A316TR95_9BACT|nr:TrmH family RNA methyltransferase [Rhodohalobacter mucosus]PWN07117.1 RNA methyltransferase [Rhodohalobacter mucosus]